MRFVPKEHKKEDARRALKAFSAASLLNDLGADSIKPFWPAFVTGALGAPASVLGLLDGMGDLVSYSSRFPSGWLSDRIRRRKPLVWLGYILAGLARIGYSLAPAVSWLFPFKAMDRLGKLRDPPRDALLADVTPKKQRGRAFGFLTSMDNLGAAAGPLMGMLLFAILSYRGMFAAAAVPSIIGALGVMLLVHEHRPKPLRLKKRKFGQRFRRFAALSALFALGWVSLSFMVLHATSLEGVPLVFVPALFVLMSLCASFSGAVVGRASDKIGKKKSLLLAYAFYVFAALGFVALSVIEISGAAGMFISSALFALYGAHYGSMTAVQPAYVAELVPPRSRAYASGLFQSAFGIATFAASAIGGLLWDLAAPVATFGYGFAISLIATIAAMLWLR